MPIISDERRRSRYDAILDAATQAFAERGFEPASIAQIARLAGVSDGLVYHYFRDKRDLLIHVLRRFYERIIVDLDAVVMRETTFPARLEALIRRHLDVFVEDRDLCRLFIAEVRTADDYQGSQAQELNRAYTSVFTRVVEDALARGEIVAGLNAALLRDAVFGAIEHRAWRFVNGGGQLDVARVARDLTLLFTQGLTPRSKR